MISDYLFFFRAAAATIARARAAPLTVSTDSMRSLVLGAFITFVEVPFRFVVVVVFLVVAAVVVVVEPAVV